MDSDILIIPILILLVLYFIPTIVAYSKARHNKGAVFIINLFLGWTFIGWVVALAWAVSNKNPPQQIIVNSNSPNKLSLSNIEQLEKLKELHEKGVINDEEFANQKSKLLS